MREIESKESSREQQQSNKTIATERNSVLVYFESSMDGKQPTKRHEQHSCTLSPSVSGGRLATS